jgi:hypothetical protein
MAKSGRRSALELRSKMTGGDQNAESVSSSRPHADRIALQTQPMARRFLDSCLQVPVDSRSHMIEEGDGVLRPWVPLEVSLISMTHLVGNGGLIEAFSQGLYVEETDMRKLTLTFLAGAGALIASGAYAADGIQTEDSSPLVHQARMVCNDAGQCWHTRGDRRVIIGGDYYGPRRYHGDYDRDYYRAPGVGVYGPGFSFGVGPGY